MSNIYNLTSSYQQAVAKINNNNSSYDEEFGDSSKKYNNYYSQQHFNMVANQAAARGETPQNNSSSSTDNNNTNWLNPSREHISEFDTIFAAFKDAHDILDEVVLVMMLMSQDTGDSSEKQAHELTSLVNESKRLKQAAEALDAINSYIKDKQAAKPPVEGPYDLNDIIKNEPSLKSALTELGNWNGQTDHKSLTDAFNTMTTNAEKSMTNVDSSSDIKSVNDDAETLIDSLIKPYGPKKVDDPTSSAEDFYNKMTDTANAATNVNQTKSAQLQGLTNNYQMQLSMITSFLQRQQDLNSKITSLT